MTGRISRRTFQMSALAAAAVAPRVRAVGPNQQVRLGFIGVGNRGCQVLRAFLAQPDAKVMALCDVYKPYRDGRPERVDPRFKNLEKRIPTMPDVPGEVDRVADFRRVLDRPDIDAVVIATPDHWHALQMIEACRAGKDVYVEKPLSIVISEGRAMVNAAREHDRVVQVGTHRRSSRMLAELAEKVRDGAIGTVTVAKTAYASNMTPHGIGKAPNSQPPADLDWDAWLGPRAMRPFNENMLPYKFRWWGDFSSQMANWGVHYFDMIRWLTGEVAPTSVTAIGSRAGLDDDRTIPVSAEATFEHASGLITTFSLCESNGRSALPPGVEVELRGTLGTLRVGGKGYEIIPERGGQFQDPAPRREPEEGSSPDGDLDQQHARTFLDAVASRQKPPADIEEGHRSTTYSLLANLALATGTRLEWDPQAERVTNHEPANALLSYEYRAPWTLG